MPSTKLDTAYAALMSKCNQGTFLYTPAIAERFHPGACGFFDEDGLWREVTDLVDVQKLRSNEYRPPYPTLELDPLFTSEWGKKVVEKNEGRHAKITAGVSAAVAAAVPVDASVNTEIGSTAEAGASLVTSPNVVRYSANAAAEEIIKKCVVDNAENMIARHRSQISEHGLWVITTTWVTEKCEISMWNKTGKNLDLGVDLGMTGIGKLGIGGGQYMNAKVDEHSTYSDEGSYVISFIGLFFKPRSWKFFGQQMKSAKPSSYLRTAPANIYVNEKGEVITEQPPALELDTETIGQPEDEEGQKAD